VSGNQDLQGLVAALFDFRTRARARRELAGLGAAAVPALLELLADTGAPENVRWSAITLLETLRCTDAVPVLQDLCRQDRGLRGAAARALTAIAGPESVPDFAKATDFSSGMSDEMAELVDEVGEMGEDTDAKRLRLFRRAVGDDATELAWEEEGETLYIRMPLAEGRKQQLLVLFGEEDSDGNRLVTFHTRCGAATPEARSVITRRNVTVRYGVFSVREEEGEEQVVMEVTVAESSLDEDRVRDIVMSMAQEADGLEFELNHSDHI
jgi:hypothetical protein